MSKRQIGGGVLLFLSGAALGFIVAIPTIPVEWAPPIPPPSRMPAPGTGELLVLLTGDTKAVTSGSHTLTMMRLVDGKMAVVTRERTPFDDLAPGDWVVILSAEGAPFYSGAHTFVSIAPRQSTMITMPVE